MSLLSLLENLRRCLESVNEIHTPTGSQLKLEATRVQLTKSELEWNAIKELIFDLAYNAELGFLPLKEMELYEKLASAYAETLLSSNKDDRLSDTEYALDHCQMVLFHSRLDDQLQEKLEQLQKLDVNQRNLNQLHLERNSVILDLVRFQCDFAETVSRICTLTSELFREARTNAQTKTNLIVTAVLTTEAEGLKAQVSQLAHSILEEARLNKAMVTQLQRTKENLVQTNLELEEEVNSLERLLRAYQSNDNEYHDLVRRYGECQRQLALRADLLLDSHSLCLTTPSRKTRSNGRRSLSMESLSTMTTDSHFLH